MFALVIDSLHFVTQQTWPIGWAARTRPNEQADAVACHEAIARAITNRDPRTAAVKMAEHFDGTARFLLAAGIT